MALEQTSDFKRHIAYKMRIGDILSGNVILDADRFKFLEKDEKHVMRVNIIANIIEKFVQEGEKQFGSITLDDASGQIKAKVFGDDIAKLQSYIQGDTVLIVGLLRSWNNELYITPEIIKKKDPQFLLLRKLELDLEKPKQLDKAEAQELKSQIIDKVKQAEEQGGLSTETLILDLKQTPDTINSEIKKLLEEGIVYEPRPGKLRYLG